MTFSDNAAQFVSVSLLVMIVAMLGLLRLNPAILRMREVRLKQSVEFVFSICTLALGLSLILFSADLGLYSEDAVFLKIAVGLILFGGCLMAGLAPFSFVRVDVGEALPVALVFCCDFLSKLALIYLLYVGVESGGEVKDIFCSIMIPIGAFASCLGWLMASVQSSFRRIIFYGSSAGLGVVILCLASFFVSLSNIWLYLAAASFALGYLLLIGVLVKGERKIGCSIHLMDLPKIYRNGRIGAAIVFSSIFLLSGAPVVAMILGNVQLASRGGGGYAIVIGSLFLSISTSFYAASTISLRMLNGSSPMTTLKKVG